MTPTCTVVEERISRPNPFSTRFVRPGAVPPLAADGRPLDIAPFLDQLGAGCLAIEGPHGCGKTTLARTLVDAIAARHRPARFLQLRRCAEAWPVVAAVFVAPAGALIAIDGWDLLPPGAGLVIAAVAARRRMTILATTHGPSWIPVIARCGSTPAILARIVASLPDHGGLIDETDIENAFWDHRGNVRDALADLYDRFEARLSRGRSSEG